MGAESASGASIDAMVQALLANGWVPRTPVLWVSPSGDVYLGPAGAYAAMLGLEREEPPWD